MTGFYIHDRTAIRCTDTMHYWKAEFLTTRNDSELSPHKEAIKFEASSSANNSLHSKLFSQERYQLQWVYGIGIIRATAFLIIPCVGAIYCARLLGDRQWLLRISEIITFTERETKII